ncbi:hypothetical protein F2Q69_00021631 [Brassica cretica]|uniref:Uncharacterized protein n=1 Tax=Brassica cretica TaxID=69181 RepID=A0A8S9QCY8_BRACR|nr:hypothetical protein F2Q69_00021631 [Brassica cretica]
MGTKPFVHPAPQYKTIETFWDEEEDAPGPRCAHTLTAVAATKTHGPRLILFGGATAIEGGNSSSVPGIRLAGVTNSVHSYDVLTRKWTRLKPAGEPPSPRAAHAAAAVGTMVVFQGGIGPAGHSTDDLYVLDMTNDKYKWHRVVVQGEGPGPRYGHVMDLVSQRYLVTVTGNDGKRALSDAWALDTAQKPYAWQRLNPDGDRPSARMYASGSARSDGMFLLCGGRDTLGVGSFPYIQLANGPTAHPPTLPPPHPSSLARGCASDVVIAVFERVGTPEMADVEDLPRTSSASGSVPPAMAPASHATVLSVPPATASSVVEPDDRVDSVGALPSPTLGDNSGNDSEKEHSAGDPVEGNKEFVGSSLLTEDALKRMWKKCGFSWEIEAQISLEEEKPWSAPPGWVCLYSLSFLQSRLWFPLPQLLTSYATNRDVAISQMSLAAIRNMVIALVRGAEVDADVYVEFFEMFSQMTFTTDETFSVSIKTRCRLMDGRGPSKADGWQRIYFFVRISPASVVDSSAVFRTEWNPQPVGHGKHWPLLSWANDRLNRILGSEKISWSDFSVERVCRSIPLSWRVGSGPSLAVGSSKRKRDASHGRCLFFGSDSDPGCHRLCRSCIDPPVSAVRSSPDELVGDRERIPLVDSPHLGVPTTS